MHTPKVTEQERRLEPVEPDAFAEPVSPELAATWPWPSRRPADA